MEADYRDTFEQAAIGLAHGTTRGYILRVNRTFAAMLGYRAEELVGQHFSDITHPHDRNEQMSNVRELLGGHRERLEFEKRYIHRGGQSVWCIVTMTLSRNPFDNEPYVIASVQDISERKRAEEAIIESEQRFRLVAAATNDAILDREPVAGRVWWNDRFEELFGTPPVDDGALFEWWKAHIHPDDRDRILSDAVRILAEPGRTSESEYRWLWEDGRVLHLHERRIVLHDGEGRLARVVISIADYSLRKRAQEALRRSEAKFRGVFESNVVGIVFWSADGTVDDANDAALELLHVTREEIGAGTVNWRKMTPHEYAELDARALAEIEATGICTPFEKEYVRGDGSRVAVLLTAASFGERGHGIAVLLDLTARDEASAAARASEERFRKLLDNCYDSVIVIDSDARTMYASPATSRVLGYSSEELLGSNVLDLVSPQDRCRAENELRAILIDPAITIRAQFRCRAKDGTCRQLEIIGRNLCDDPLIGGIVLNSRDVTQAAERKFVTVDTK